MTARCAFVPQNARRADISIVVVVVVVFFEPIESNRIDVVNAEAIETGTDRLRATITVAGLSHTYITVV